MAEPKKNGHQDQELLDLLEEARHAMGAFPRGDHPDLSGEAERMDRILTYADLIVRDSDPQLVPAGARSAAMQVLVNVRDNTATARSQPPDTDGLLEALSRLPASRGRDAQQGVIDIAERFQRSTSQRLNTVRSRATAAQAAIRKENSETAQGLENLKSILDTRAGEIDQRLTDLHASMDSARSGVDALLRDEQQRFADEMQERERALTDLHQQNEQELTDMRERQRTTGDEHLEKLGEQAERARALMDVVTSTGTQGAYQDRANKDEKTAGRYRMLAFATGMGAVALATALFLFGDKGEYPLAKLGVVTTMLTVAALLWRFANSKQQTAEGRREQELKLASFQAVLETLPEEQVAEQICWFFQQQYARDAEPARRDADTVTTPLRRLLPGGEQDRDAA